MTSQLAIGLDIGGTKIAIAAVDGSGRIAAQAVIPTEADQGFDRALHRMVQTIDEVLASAGWSRGDLCGVGIGCTGPVSAERGTINNPYTLPGWVECDIVAQISRLFSRPAYLENDADAAALGESLVGAGRGYGKVVMLTLGTGVGGGVVIDDNVYRGTGGEHPELGHIPIDPAGPPCYCGTRGCLEAIASGTAIAAAGGEVGLADSRQVFAQAALGEPRAVAIIERAQAAVKMAAWTILHTFMPELIVLGGGIIDQHYELFAPAIESQIPLATMVPAGGVRVAKAILGNDAGVVGAASLAIRRSHPASSA